MKIEKLRQRIIKVLNDEDYKYDNENVEDILKICLLKSKEITDIEIFEIIVYYAMDKVRDYWENENSN